MRALVCGGRDYNNREFVYDLLDNFRPIITFLIHGDAPGADRLAAYWALDRHIPAMAFPADWTDLTQPNARIKTRSDGTQYDANAGPRRNALMLSKGFPGCVIAFPGGIGTKNMVTQAERLKIPVFRIVPK